MSTSPATYRAHKGKCHQYLLNVALALRYCSRLPVCIIFRHVSRCRFESKGDVCNYVFMVSASAVPVEVVLA